MTWKVGAKKGYPIMELRKWRRRVCAACNAGEAGCISFRKSGTCPLDDKLGQLEKSLKEHGR